MALASVPESSTALPARPLLPDLLRSEWTKLRSVRSTYWTLLAAAAATIGLGAILCAVYVSHYSHLSLQDRARFNAASFSLSGIMLAQLAVGVLGVLIITSEYSTGMIRATFTATPQRRLVLGAKAAVFAGVMIVIGIASCFAAFFAGQAILGGHNLQTTIGHPGVLRAVVGGGLYLAVLGLLSLGIGTLIRHTAGAIAAVFGLILVLPGIISALPSSWSNAIGPYLPSTAGQAVFNVGHRFHELAPWAGFGIFCAYAAAALAGAALLLSCRDA
jgi:ABC-2 type transport system permease protein